MTRCESAQTLPSIAFSRTLGFAAEALHQPGRLVKRKEEGGGIPSSSLLFVLSFVLLFGVGGDLLSHNLPVAVPSACAGLASGFGMGPGVSLQLLTTDKLSEHLPSLMGVWVLCQILHSGRGHDSDCFLFCCFLPAHIVCVGVCCGQLVPVAFTPYSASRSGLSTLSSLGDLNETSS